MYLQLWTRSSRSPCRIIIPVDYVKCENKRTVTAQPDRRVLPVVKVNPLPNKGPLPAPTFTVPFPRPKGTYADMTEI